MSHDYQFLEQIEHVLKRPNSYMGSVETKQDIAWVFDNNHIELKDVIYNPGIDHLISELLANVTDHVEKCKQKYPNNLVTKVDITFNDDTFSIKNNGQGIKLIKEPTQNNKYLPELIFGRLLSGSNFDDTQQRTQIGTNGYGIKLVNIMSLLFELDLCTNGQTYKQTFLNNMLTISEPVISEQKKTKSKIENDYVSITFKPDFKRFGLKSFSTDEQGNPIDMISVIKKTIIDSISTCQGVKWTINDERYIFNNFTDYAQLYVPKDQKVPIVSYETDNHHWKIVVIPNLYKEQTHITFVNGLYTPNNGTHLKYIKGLMAKGIKEILTTNKSIIKILTDQEKDSNKKPTIESDYIINNMTIFIGAVIINPSFNSQSKTELTTIPEKFKDYPCKFSGKFFEDLVKKLSLKDKVLEIMSAKETKVIMKKMSNSSSTSSSSKRLTDIDKLDDANLAGTKESKSCILLLTEGDSAKTFASNGISAIPQSRMKNSRDYIGIFPLKGKLLNVKSASLKQLANNEELININKILGLSFEPLTPDTTKLRYGKVMILSDSDLDGFHIRALLINYLTEYWPHIVAQEFITTMLLPVIVATTKDSSTIPFYNITDYEKWSVINKGNHERKYYKGLATIDPNLCKEYFSNFDDLKISYTYNPDKESDDNKSLLLAFDIKRENDRKELVINTTKAIENGELDMDRMIRKIPVAMFMKYEAALFSVEDNIRSIPNILDGLKPSQRKIIYGLFNRPGGGSREVKVADLASNVSELTDYHYGSTSLEGAIVNLAQSFVGAGNNLPLLVEIGGFGSRIKGGEDAGSPRYIYTKLQPYIKYIAPKQDFPLLKYNKSDDKIIEPKMYVFTVPIVLLNNPVGIGSGFSTNIPSFKLEDILDRLRTLITDPSQSIKEMMPYYDGFRGTIIKISNPDTAIRSKWKCTGVFTRLTTKNIIVNELPIGVWYDNFKIQLNTLITNGVIVKYDVCVTTDNTNVYDYNEYNIHFVNDISDDEIMSVLKLTTVINGTNFTGFDKNGIIRHYEHAQEILYFFYKSRLVLYYRRKEYMIDDLKKRILFLIEKARFIMLIVNDTLIINKRKKIDIENDLIKFNFKKLTNERESEEIIEGSFNYLLGMQISSLTVEKIAELNKQRENLENELKILESIAPENMWLKDLELLEQSVKDTKKEMLNDVLKIRNKGKKTKKN